MSSSQRPFPSSWEWPKNDDDGVVDGNRVMSKMKKACINMGGEYQETRVLHLHSDEKGMIDAVVTSGDAINATQTDVILAAGPWIMQLIEASHVRQPPNPSAPLGTNIFAFHLDMDPQQWGQIS